MELLKDGFVQCRPLLLATVAFRGTHQPLSGQGRGSLQPLPSPSNRILLGLCSHLRPPSPDGPQELVLGSSHCLWPVKCLSMVSTWSYMGLWSQLFLLGQSPSEAVLGLVSLALASIWATGVCKHSGWPWLLSRPSLGIVIASLC